MENALWILVGTQVLFGFIFMALIKAKDEKDFKRSQALYEEIQELNTSMRNLNSDDAKWEYTWSIKHTEMGSWGTELNRMTDDGWELVSLVEESTLVTVDGMPKEDNGRKIFAYFKRRIS
jgi:hypothetical protein